MSLYTPYNLTKSEIGYEFVSGAGVRYHLYFSNYYLTDADGNDLVVPMFGFDCVPERSKQDRNQKRHDPRIKATIISLIVDFFEKKPNDGLLYICDQKDDKAENRSILFGAWHKEMADKIEKYDNEHSHAELDFYSSLLIVKDNPDKNKFIEAFYRHLDDMLS